MMIQNKKIGIFDSGVGGLTVLKELKAICPNESFMYIGDTKNLPYGTKTKEELFKITSKIFDFYKLEDVKAVVMACNTTSAVVWEDLKNNYNFPIYPLSQTVCKYFNNLNILKIGVFATLATVNSQIYQKSLNAKTFAVAPVEWVDIVEADKINEAESQENIKKYCMQMKEFNPEKIILGCTHYPYLIKELQKYFDERILINPARIYAQAVKEDLNKKNLLNTSEKSYDDEFYVTGSVEQFLNNSKQFYSTKIKPQVVELS